MLGVSSAILFIFEMVFRCLIFYTLCLLHTYDIYVPNVVFGCHGFMAAFPKVKFEVHYILTWLRTLQCSFVLPRVCAASSVFFS